MATEAQMQANRQNARKSTGPRTPEGKARSSQNSLKHGLTAAHLVISIEDRGDFEEFRASLFAELKPVGTVETLLVSQIAAGYYRMQRIASMETGVYEKELTDRQSATPSMTKLTIFEEQSPIFTLLRRYDGAAVSLYFRSMSQLTKLQAARRRDEQIPEVPAPDIIQITDSNGDPVDPASQPALKIGFVSHSASAAVEREPDPGSCVLSPDSCTPTPDS